MTMRIRIRNGRLLDPGRGLDRKGDLFIADGRIAGVGKLEGFTADREIDAAGCIVAPGLVDLSARFREPGFEQKGTIASESAAAVAGGVTTVCTPPDTSPIIDTPAVVELIHRRTAATGRARILPLGALTRGLGGETLAEMRALRDAGCVGVSNGLRPVPNSEVLRRAMEYAASFGLTVHLYAEDHQLRNAGVAHEGRVSTRLGLRPSPAVAETIGVSRALLLAEYTGARLHLCRISSARSVELIAEAKARGLPVTADVAICNLVLTEDDVDGFRASCHLLPPLRSAADRDALLRGVREGVIDAVCSDHQPHDDDAKAAPFSLTEPGASTIETLLPLLLQLVESKAIDLSTAVAAVTAKPAAVLGSEAGTLAAGAPADVTIVDPAGRVRVEASALRSAGRNSPFLGRELPGRVNCTLLGGDMVFEAGEPR